MKKINISVDKVKEALESSEAFYAFMQELIELGRKQGRKEASMEIMRDILEAEKND